jgi:hypothetical protein
MLGYEKNAIDVSVISIDIERRLWILGERCCTSFALCLLIALSIHHSAHCISVVLESD